MKKSRKRIFSVIVLIIVLAFAASFIGSGLTRKKNNEEADQAQNTNTSENGQADELSPFILSVKASMIESEDNNANAANISKAINVYNSLSKESKLLSFDGETDSFVSLSEKLEIMGIYFDEISETSEKAAWRKVNIDENGVATVK